MRRSHTRGLVAGISLGLAIAAFVPTREAGAGPLATPGQIALDARFARIYRRPDFQAQMRASEGQLAGSDIAKREGASRRIREANQAVTVAALQLMLADDAGRPVFYWTPDAARRWAGVVITFAGWVLNNPDNVYRVAAIDGASRYEVTGRLGHANPTHPSFFLFRCIPGDGSPNIDSPIGGIRSEDLKASADGAFTITIDPETANGRPNHIQSRADARLLVVRESLVDWGGEALADLNIRRVAGPPPLPARSDEEIMGRALQFARAANSMWIDGDGPRILKIPVNTVERLRGRGGGWGYLAAGNFRIQPDEALVVTVDPMAAAYTGFQLGDVWGIPLDYINHIASLTNKQARPNEDGSYTYVIAARDPKIFNWLDTDGLLEGAFLLRWQMLPADRDPTKAVRSAEVVKVSDLVARYPAGLMTDEKARAAQRAERTASWGRRLK